MGEMDAYEVAVLLTDTLLGERYRKGSKLRSLLPPCTRPRPRMLLTLSTPALLSCSRTPRADSSG